MSFLALIGTILQLRRLNGLGSSRPKSSRAQFSFRLRPAEVG